MSQIDFILLVTEFFQLTLLLVLLSYALFFSGLGQSTQVTSSSPVTEQDLLSNPVNTDGSKLKISPGLSVIGGGTLRPQQLVRSAYLSTPLQTVEPLSWLIALGLMFTVALYMNNPAQNAVLLTSSFVCDDFATLFKILLCLSSAAAIVLSIPSKSNLTCFATKISDYEFLLIIYLAIIGMLCLISSYNLLTLYLSIELQSLSFYLLACMKSRSEFSAEAGLKYFILGAFSSAILLFGISLIYGSIGSIYFDDIAALVEFSGLNNSFQSWSESGTSLAGAFGQGPYVGLGIGLICICISLLFKLAAVPFHVWAPDVYEGSPMSVTAFFAITAKIAALAVLVRFLILTGQHLSPLLILVSMASLVVGTLSAMRQVKIKRLIAFSGISNIGWFLMGLCSGRLDGVVLHLIVYIMLSITLFSVIIQPILRVGGGEASFRDMTIKHISDLGQVYKTNSTIALALTLALFSLGGIPLLAGFYSKYLIINGAIQAEALPLLVIGLLSAVFSAFYYIRVVKVVYFSSPQGFQDKDWFSFAAPSNINAYLIALTSFFTLCFIMYPESIAIWIIPLSI